MKKKRHSRKSMKEEEECFDVSKSILPKWLLYRGISCHYYEMFVDKSYLIKRLKEEEKIYSEVKLLFKQAKQKLDKKAYRIFKQEVGWKLSSSKREVKECKEELKNFNIVYFEAEDVEKAFRELLKKK